MTFLEKLAEEVASAVSRTYRVVARWALRRMVDLFNLFRTLILFVPLIYFIGLGYELTYAEARMPRYFGWGLVVGFVLFIIWAIIEMFFGAKTDAPESPFLWFFCTVLSFVLVLLILTAHYEFRSPILAVTQRFPASLRKALSDSRVGRSNHGAMQFGEIWQRINSVPSPAKDPDTHLTLWAEGVHSTSLGTVIDLACKTWSDSESATLNSASGAYVVDQGGRKYDLVKDFGGYSAFWGERKVFGGEIYKWSLAIPRIRDGATALILKHPQFQDIHIQIVVDQPSVVVPTGSSTATLPDGVTSSKFSVQSGQSYVTSAGYEGASQNTATNAEQGASGDERIYRVEDGVSAPELLSKSEPQYTEQARASKIQGEVTLQVVISKEGRPEDVIVLHGIDEGLDQSAIEAIKRWRFSPGTKAGLPVRVAATISVQFRLL